MSRSNKNNERSLLMMRRRSGFTLIEIISRNSGLTCGLSRAEYRLACQRGAAHGGIDADTQH